MKTRDRRRSRRQEFRQWCAVAGTTGATCCYVGSDVEHLQVGDGALHGPRVQMVEHESRLRMAVSQLGRRLPAHMTEHVAWPGRFHAGDVRAFHQLVEWAGRFGVARGGDEAAVDLVPVV